MLPTLDTVSPVNAYEQQRADNIAKLKERLGPVKAAIHTLAQLQPVKRSNIATQKVKAQDAKPRRLHDDVAYG